MIDTTKFFTFINKDIYDVIKYNSNIKCMYNQSEDMIFYEIINSSLTGSYDSSLSVRVIDAGKYLQKGYVIEVEGSYHKICKGHNSYDGFYNIQEICLGMKKLVENAYHINLPDLKHWFLQRIDIAKCFDLNNNSNVKNYINNFRTLTFPRRNLNFYEDESLYILGQTTTLKIYNKLKEFLKHDKKKLIKYNDFNVFEFCNKIDGYIRFECEVKKKKLKSMYNTNFVRVNSLKYSDFEKVWCDEFMKLLKFDNNEIKKVRDKESVYKRLNSYYDSRKASDLYNFYLAIKVDGEKFIKNNMTKATFYRKRKELKEVGVDFCGCYKIYEEDNISVDFNPFYCEEVS